jgi:predicted MFS family arabinose efflux permease
MRAYALLRLAANLGMGIGPAAGGLLALRGYGWLFVANALACWASLALSLCWLGTGAPLPAAEPGPGPRRGRSPWSDGPFLLLLLLVVSLASVFFQTMSTLPLYFRETYGFREDAIGALLAFNPFLIVAFEMALIHWADRRPPLPLIGLGSFLTCAGLALMPFGRSIGFVLFTILVWTVGEMLALPLTNGVVARRAEPRNLGRYMGAYTMAFSAAFVFAPAAGTWVLERFGADALWLSIGACGAALWVGALALEPLFRPERAC